jgi:hypothetical protein
MKRDESIKNIVIASIRRHSMDMNSWTHTRLWEEGDPEKKAEIATKCRLNADELPILYSYIDPQNWTLFSTRSVSYSNEGKFGHVVAVEIGQHSARNFKGYSKQCVERMRITTKDGQVHNCPFATGKESMGPIDAIMTIRSLNRSD